MESTNENSETTTNENRATATPERDAAGQFKKGNKGGPGNPYARQCAVLRREMHKAITGDDIQVIIKALTKRAIEGDVAAAKLVLSYTVGKPGHVYDPDTIDQHEVRTTLEKHANYMDDLATVKDGMPAKLQVQMFRILEEGTMPTKLEILQGSVVEDEDEEYEIKSEDDYTAEELAEFDRAHAADDKKMAEWIYAQEAAAMAPRPAPRRRAAPSTNRKSPDMLDERLRDRPMTNGRHGPSGNGKM